MFDNFVSLITTDDYIIYRIINTLYKNTNMGGETDIVPLLSNNIKIDPTEFDVTITALLIGLGAEKYVEIFRKHNIGQLTLAELSEEDLVKLGLDDGNIRKKLLVEVRNLPMYEESIMNASKCSNLDPLEIVDILDESSQHLYRIYLSMLANTLALKKTKNISDSLLYKDKYASGIALCTLSEITSILNAMEITLFSQMKMLTKESTNKTKKKIFVRTVGSAAIALLAVLFVRSLKQLK